MTDGPGRSLTLLHLSDPQFGRLHRPAEGATAGDREHDTLRARLVQDLRALVESDDSRTHSLRSPDLVVVTGDLSEWARRSEMAQFEAFAGGLLRDLQLAPERLVIVPGNHDVSWKACEAYFAQCEAEELEPQPPYWPKWRFYAELFDRLYGGPQAPFEFNEQRPWSLFVFESLRTVVAGLNSTMPETHREGEHYGELGEQQLRWFCEQMRPFEEQGWLRIAALHHNVQRKAQDDDENLRDADRLDRILGDHVNVVLHGHTHDGKLGWLRPQVPILSTGSAAIADVARPHGVPCQYQLLQFHAQGLRRWTRAYQPAQQRWVGDTAASADGNEWRHDHPVPFAGVQGVFPAPAPHRPATDETRGGRRVEADEPASASVLTALSSLTELSSAPAVVDDFLHQLAEICRLRDPTVEVVRRRKGPPVLDYLELRHRHGELVPVGGSEHGVDESQLEAFIQRVVLPYRTRDQGVRPVFVFGGPPAAAALVERARAAGVWLRSYEQHCGLIDFRRYRARLAQRLSADRVYPPARYVGQRMVEHLGRQQQRHEDALGIMRSWLDDEHGRFVLVLGTFGTGKTFLLRQLARRLAVEDGAAVPILVEMRNLEKGLRLEQLLAQHFALHDVDDFSPARFMRMLEDGRVVLLFDGFDELVVRSTYARAAEHFETIVSAARGRAKVVVTSRRQHFLSDHQAKEAVRQVLMQKVEAVPGHRVVTLLPFEDDQIEQFLAGHLGDRQRARERMHLIGQLRDLSGLSANPRMLGFIAALDDHELRTAHDRRGAVSAAGLYRSLLERWLTFEDDRRHPRGAAPGLSIDDRWRAVTELATRLWTRGEHRVEVHELEDIGAVLAELARTSKEEAGFQIGSGTLLVRDEIGRFSFIHESVLEWLVARAAAEALGTDEAPPLLGQGKMSTLLADFLIDLAGPEVCARWSSRALAANVGNAMADNALRLRQRLSAAGLVVEEQAEAGVDLSHQDLRGRDLSGQSLRSARLVGADLRGANLRGTALHGAVLEWAQLRDADLTRAYLRGADLSHTDLRGATLCGANLRGATLQSADLRRTKLWGAKIDPGALATAKTEGAALPDSPLEPLLARPLGRVGAVAFSTNGELLAVHDGPQLRLWDTHSARELRRLPQPENPSSAWDIEGFEFATSDDAGGDNVEALLYRVDERQPAEASFEIRSPDGRTSVDWSQRRLSIKGRNGGLVGSGGPSGPALLVELPRSASQVAFVDNDHLVVLFHSGLVQVWSLDPISAADLDTVRRPVVGLAVHRGAILLVLEDQQLLLYRPTQEQRTTGLVGLTPPLTSEPQYEAPRVLGGAARPPITGLAATAEGGMSVLAGHRLSSITITQRMTSPILHLSAAERAVLSRDGLGLATIRGSQLSVHRFFPVEGREPVSVRHSLAETPALLSFAGHGSGRLLLASGGDRSTIQQLDVLGHEPGAPLEDRGTAGRAVALSCSPSGHRIAAACSDHAIWQLSAGSQRVLEGHEWSITGLDLIDRPPRLVSTSSDGTVRLWDLQNYTQLHAWPLPRARSVAFGPDLLVAAGDLQGRVTLWRADTFEQVASTVAHDAAVTHLAFPARTLMATGSVDGTVKLWRLPSMTLLATFASLREGWIAFAPDGRYKTGGRLSGEFWHAAALCRFEVGEFDELVPDLRVSDEAPLVVDHQTQTQTQTQ